MNLELFKQTKYVIDTSALVDLYKYYKPETFKNLWDDLDQLAKNGGIISSRYVFKELEKKEDYIFNWAKEHKHMFKAPTPEQLEFVGKIQVEFLYLVDWNSEQVEADPFVISLAKFTNTTVIAHEKLKPNAHKIPNVCKFYEIKCIELDELFTEENWTY